MKSINKYSSRKVRRLKQIVFVFTFIGLSIFWLPAFSQTDTQADTTTNQTDNIIKYLSPLEYAFMMHEETSWLFKVSYSQITSDFYSLGASIEKSIASSFTLSYKLDVKATVNNEKINYNNITNSLETKWYYRMNKRIRENKGSINMSGNYLSLSIENYFSLGFHYYASTPYVKWGIQRRFLKNSFIDFGFKAGVGGLFRQDRRTSLIIGTFTNIGLAFTKDKYKLDHEKLCPVLKCYDADNFVIKSDLVSLFQIFLSNDLGQIVINPNIALERKIGKSVFSINTELNLQFRHLYQSVNPQVYKNLNYGVDFMLEGRWYYNLKNRMLKGKTGNSLSANYIAMGGSYTFSRTNNYEDSISKIHYPTIHLTTGMQRLISEHIYYDFNIGIGYQFESKKRPGFEGGMVWPINFAVGYRF